MCPEPRVDAGRFWRLAAQDMVGRGVVSRRMVESGRFPLHHREGTGYQGRLDHFLDYHELTVAVFRDRLVLSLWKEMTCMKSKGLRAPGEGKNSDPCEECSCPRDLKGSGLRSLLGGIAIVGRGRISAGLSISDFEE